ncbi:MAG: hypothetical protein UT38_C0016G0017 [Microgenomates group bacterium GW2011_GWA2_39_19]|nr:MAG: hypothetical protein UT38_C0016G0017 [Microgenomates group bacterium GW2011_GWA2_39_19]HBL52111.1 hypothetical protein [Candidatus Blackburnbacteria bacterium]
MKKLLAISTFAFFALLLTPKQALADVRCESQYGGGQVCVTTGQLQVNKKVCDPDKGSCDPTSAGFSDRLIDNLGLSSRRFTPGDNITFRIEVKNVGSTTINNVSVTDTLPAHLELVSGDLSFNIGSLGAGQVVSRDIVAKVVSADKFTVGSVACEVNTATVTGDGVPSDSNTAQICMSKEAVLPKAGPENWYALPLLSLFAAATGLAVRRTRLSK